MSVFNPPHFLRHIGMPTLREFTEAHVLGTHLTVLVKKSDRIFFVSFLFAT